jgi:hypothetical protein
LTVANFGSEQVLMVTVEDVAFEVFIGSVAYVGCGARQSTLCPWIKA